MSQLGKGSITALVLAAMVSVASLSADAADRNGNFRGVHTKYTSCSDHLKTLTEVMRSVGPDEYESELVKYAAWKSAVGYWIAGFVTGINYAAPDTYDIIGRVGWPFTVDYIESWCEQNATKNLTHAVSSLVDQLWAERLKEAP